MSSPSWTPNLPSLSVPNTSGHGRHASKNSAHSVHRSSSAGHRRSTSQLTESDILENAFNIPILSPASTRRTPQTHVAESRRPSMHGRSISHPFPFMHKEDQSSRDGGRNMGFEAVNPEGGNGAPGQYQASYGATKSSPGADRDLMTGKCMTCDSMVRWPKDLKVFRCTVCLTINDLVPIALQKRRGVDHPPLADRSAEENNANRTVTSQVTPISLQKTTNLINDCIKAYLQHRMRQIGARATKEVLQYEKSRQSDTTDSHYDIPRSTLYGSEHGSVPDFRSSEATSTFTRSGRMASSTSERHDTVLRGSMSTAQEAPIIVAPLPSSFKESTLSEQQHTSNESKTIFKRLEDYIIDSLHSHRCLNTSFSSQPLTSVPQAGSEDAVIVPSPSVDEKRLSANDTIWTMDEKTLLIGDFAENGAWWTGRRSAATTAKQPRVNRAHSSFDKSATIHELVTSKSPRIDWCAVDEWYDMICHAGRGWRDVLEQLSSSDGSNSECLSLAAGGLEDLRFMFSEAESHIRRVLLKATEALLKRPGGILKEPADIRFLLIVLGNPLLYPSSSSSLEARASELQYVSKNVSSSQQKSSSLPRKQGHLKASSMHDRTGPGRHSGILKRIFGLLSNLSNECHHHLVAWFARLSASRFRRITELLGGFVTYRLTRQHGKRRAEESNPVDAFVPSMSSNGHSSSAALHAALDIRHNVKPKDGRPKPVVYNDDWQIKAAARVMALLFSANNTVATRQVERAGWPSKGPAQGEDWVQRRGQTLATSDFYNTLLDYSDLIADFEAWESKRGKFTFCQYPFFLSIWAKIQIMEHDARRQMEVKAREAFFDSIMTRKTVNQYLILKVRRDCLVEDSLKGVSEVVGSGTEEIKKGLRIEFKGEEGIDAGGLRKEWFLLLVRDVFNPEHGMFSYDEESQACYFNPNSFETSDQFFLVGVVLGLAIYNSTILDVALPSFAFRKLLAAGPSAASGKPSHAKPSMVYTLQDLAEYRPSLASGLQQLLDFEGDVQQTYCRDFVADIERFGQIQQVPLCPGGENKPVTNSNRKEFADLYVKYLLDTAVIRQFEPFKRGFFTVCGGNALSLFRPEEIELLVRGSDEPLDIDSLQAVAVYDNWGVTNPARSEQVVHWFWQSFKRAPPADQRKLLSFITGSDRIPAMGAANLVIKLSCLGDDCMRFPVARTCFNMLSLWRYGSADKLERMLWRAVNESEGFGLK